MNEMNVCCDNCGTPIGQHRYVFERSIEVVDSVLSAEEFITFLEKEGYSLDEKDRTERIEDGRPETIISPIIVEPLYRFCCKTCWENKSSDIIKALKLKRRYPDIDQSVVECSKCGAMVVRFREYKAYNLIEEEVCGCDTIDGETQETVDILNRTCVAIVCAGKCRKEPAKKRTKTQV
jgi:hypothetical protein